MKAAQITQYGGDEVVVINNVPKPTAQEGEVVVEVYAAGVNPSDWKIREGYMKQMVPLTFPATIGGDFSGVVAEIGTGVTTFRRGDEVYGRASFLRGGSGSFAEYTLAKKDSVAIKPKNISHEEAGALPLVGVSASQALLEHMQLKSGQKILIHGAAGGIGSIAVQIAKSIGAHVAATAAESDVKYVQSLGANKVIDYQKEKFEEIVKDFDAVFDTIGGDTYRRSFTVLRKGGIIVSMLEQPDVDRMKQYGVRGAGQYTQVTHDRLLALTKFVENGAVTVTIDKLFPLDNTREALAYLKMSHSRGKVVTKVEQKVIWIE